MNDVPLYCTPQQISQNSDKSLNIRPRRIMRQSAVSEATGYSRSSLYNMMKAGTFPKAHRIGPRAIGWDSQEVQAWIDERLNGSDA